MAVYFITGKLGSGKTLAAVGRIRDYLRAGRAVATNLDLFPEKMLPPGSRMPVHRLPDKPRVSDLEAMGNGYEGPEDDYREDAFGALVLDELGTWFNSRSWNDKERAKVIDWFLHARKYRWDVYLIVQDINVVDKQLRETLCEHLVICRRLDRLAVPFVGAAVKALTGIRLKPPQIHVGTVYYGDSAQGFRVDRWWYRGRDLYRAYRTRQVFVLDQMFSPEGDAVDMRCAYSVLSAWHVKGRYQPSRTLTDLINYLLRQVVLWVVQALATASGRSPGAVARALGFRQKSVPKPVRFGPARPALLSPSLDDVRGVST